MSGPRRARDSPRRWPRLIRPTRGRSSAAPPGGTAIRRRRSPPVSAPTAGIARQAMPAGRRGWRCGSLPITSTSAATTRLPWHGCSADGRSSKTSRPCLELGFITCSRPTSHCWRRATSRRAERLAREALELAQTTGEVDVEAVALAILGSALISSGAVEEGLKRLDEGAALAVSEDFGDAASPGWTLCHTVSGCAHAGDFDRAEQWCRALHSWSAAWRARHFFGICRTAYGGVLVARGDWSSAEEELSTAIDDVQTTRPRLAAPTAVRLASLRARQGRLDEARAAVRVGRAASRMRSIGLGELDLQAGDATAAAEIAERVLRRPRRGQPFERLPSLELLARARAAEGDADAARAALEQISEEGPRHALLPGAGCASSAPRSLAAAGDHEDARRAAEDAVDCSPTARPPTRVLAHGCCWRARWRPWAGPTGPPPRPARRRRRWRCSATPGRRGRETTAAGELSPREVDILRLVAEGMSDARIAEQLFLSPHTVHRHVANIRTKLRARSRAAAVAAGHEARPALTDGDWPERAIPQNGRNRRSGTRSASADSLP